MSKDNTGNPGLKHRALWISQRR